MPRSGSRVRVSFPAPNTAIGQSGNCLNLRYLWNSTGWVAEWSCSGLQLRVRRFDSDLSLHFKESFPACSPNSSPCVVSFYIRSCQPSFRPGGETGRHKGLKIPRGETPVPVRFRSRAPIKSNTYLRFYLPVDPRYYPSWGTGGTLHRFRYFHELKFPSPKSSSAPSIAPRQTDFFRLNPGYHFFMRPHWVVCEIRCCGPLLQIATQNMLTRKKIVTGFHAGACQAFCWFFVCRDFPISLFASC